MRIVYAATGTTSRGPMNIHIIRVPEEEKEQEIGNLFEK